jgi:hypothetical protein
MNIQSLADGARETMQEFDGDEYIPQLLVEFEDGELAVYILANFPGNPQTPTSVKQRYFESVGKICRSQHKTGTITELCFVCEIWGVHRTKDHPRDFRYPSEAPDRREYLMFMHLDAQTGKQRLSQFEIKSRGPHTELGPLITEEWDTYDNALLPAFRAGWQGSTYHKGSHDGGMTS